MGRYKFLNTDVVLSLNVVLILANSEDTDEMKQHAAFHLDLHYLPNNPFRGFQYTKGSCDIPPGPFAICQRIR